MIELSIEVTEAVLINVALTPFVAHCCLGVEFSWKMRFPKAPEEPCVKGTPLLKVTVASVSLTIATESAKIEVNLN